MLITKAYIKQRFPSWQFFIEQMPDGSPVLSDDEKLDLIIEDSEGKLLSILTLTDTDMNANLRRHLLNIVKKFLWDLKHGDTVFEDVPQVNKDYEDTLQYLHDVAAGRKPLTGPAPASADDIMHIDAKQRDFGGPKGTWFTRDDSDAEGLC